MTTWEVLVCQNWLPKKQNAVLRLRRRKNWLGVVQVAATRESLAGHLKKAYGYTKHVETVHPWRKEGFVARVSFFLVKRTPLCMQMGGAGLWVFDPFLLVGMECTLACRGSDPAIVRTHFLWVEDEPCKRTNAEGHWLPIFSHWTALVLMMMLSIFSLFRFADRFFFKRPTQRQRATICAILLS